MIYDTKDISRKNFRDIIDFSADAILALDKDKKIVLFNRMAQKLFGYSEVEIQGRPLDILLPQKARAHHDEYMHEFEKAPERSRGMGKRSTVQGLTKSNELIPLDISIQKHPQGEKLRYSAVIRDMTDHFKTIEILEKSEDRLSRAQRITHTGHWEWTILTGELHWSDEIYRIFGQTKGVDEVTYDNFLKAIHPEDRDNVAKYVNWCVERKMPYAITHRIMCPDGTVKVVHEKGEIFCDEEGIAVRMDGTVQDVTENWEREEQLRLVSEQAEAANRAKSQFLATMSHELRTPLNAIIGMSTMIEEEVFGPISPKKYMEYITDIKNSGYHLLGHINNILDISNVEMKNFETIAVEVTPQRLIDACIQIVTPLSMVKNTRFTIALDEKIERVNVDASHCKKILVNLLSNAVKFSHQGGEIRIGLEKDESEENIIFSVEDFGVGFDEDDTDNLFKPFTQEDMNFARKYDGAGLGLSIVKALTEAQGGKVVFDSKINEGTLVKIILPLNMPENDSRWI